MGRQLKLQPRQLPDSRWLVDIPSWLSEKGKRERRFFPSKAQALSFVEELKTRQHNLSVRPELSTSQICDAADAYALAGDRTDIRLVETMRLYLEVETARKCSVTLKELLERYISSRPKDTSWHYRVHLTNISRWLTPLHERMVCDLTRSEILSGFEGVAPATRNSLLQGLRAILVYALEAGYLKDPLLRRVDFIPPKRVQEVEVMPPGEVRRLLELTLSYLPETFPVVVVEIFCGVRPAEAVRLLWSDVDLLRKRLTIRAAISKTKTARPIELMPSAIAWFDAYIEAGHLHTGPFTTLSEASFNESRMGAVRRIMGYRGKGQTRSWRPGILRDTFASCHLAYHESIDKLLREIGHTNFSMTRNHYLGAVTREEAEAFWNIFPSKGEKIVQLPVTSA